MISAKVHSKISKIQDLRRRGDWKKAYKEALFLSRNHNEPELRQLLVSSLWGWIKEQFHRNQIDEAKANIKELLRFLKMPNTDVAEIQHEFPSIFRSLGLNALLPEHLRQDMSSPEVQTELVDRFFVRGGSSDDLLPEIRSQAFLVREALEKVEAKHDNEALELLRSIPFHSPLSEWRLFVRGLISYYQKNDEKAEESWKRLSESRPPHRIVARLKKFLTDNRETSTQNFVLRLFDLFHAKTDSPQARKAEFLSHLRQLDNYIRQKKFKELVGHFQSSRSFLQQTEPQLYDRIFRLVYSSLVDDAMPDVVRQFIERNLPLPLDPSGNRTLGLLAAGKGNTECMRPRWLKKTQHYFELFAEQDIDRIESFTPKMKARAKAVVYDWLGNLLLQPLSRFDMYPDSDFPIQEKILDYFNKAIENDPTYTNSYHHLQAFYSSNVNVQERNEINSKIAEINRKLLEHVPEDKDALKYLFSYYLIEKKPSAAAPYFERLRNLDPLSRETAFLTRQFQFARLRELLQLNLLQKETKELFEEIENSNFETILYRLDALPFALRYVFEIISFRPSEAENVFALAEKKDIKRLPLILAIFAEAETFPLPKPVIESLRNEWKTTIIGRCNGNIAGALGDIVYGFLKGEKEFFDSEKILDQALAFVNRSGQVKWKCEKDLFGACNVLWHVTVNLKKQKYEATYRKLVQKALSQFPKSPYFAFFDAETFFLEEKYFQKFRQKSAIDKYQKFLERCNGFRNDPQLEPYLTIAKRRFQEIDSVSEGFPPYYNDDDDGSLDDDIPFLSPEVRKLIAENGLTPEVKQQLFDCLPKEMGALRPFLFEVFMECLARGALNSEQFSRVLQEKIENMSFFEQMKFMSSLPSLSGINPDEDEEDEEEDEEDDIFFPFFLKRKKKKKKKKKK
ncbi:MAG: hypothetical protein LBQ50_10125 [Planctomycetaceae bacterium]|jgi:tetratricopeptide (TPR) repeat protein|nr:hypothetical protein [Planctomycetaceae bacterium]